MATMAVVDPTSIITAFSLYEVKSILIPHRHCTLTRRALLRL